MVIAVVAVWVMQPTIDEVVVVVAVRHKFVTAAVVSTLTFNGLALSRIGCVDGDNMLIIVAFVWAVQMTVVQIINVSIVLNTGMSAELAVDVGMVWVIITLHYEILLVTRYQSS